MSLWQIFAHWLHRGQVADLRRARPLEPTPPPAAPIPERPPHPDLEPFKITILARRSSGGWYPVTFTCRDNRLWLKCGCTAGKFSWFCKHKFNLLDGNECWLYDASHRPDLARIRAVLPYTGFPPLLKRYKLALKPGSENALKEIKKQLKLAMRHGA